MHLILKNCSPLLDVLTGHFFRKKQIKFNPELNKKGQGHLHAIVMPNEFGWIENTDILRTFLNNEIGDCFLKDSNGKTFYELACEI